MTFVTMNQFQRMCEDSYKSFKEHKYTKEEIENAEKMLNETATMITLSMAASLIGLSNAIAEVKLGNKDRIE